VASSNPQFRTHVFLGLLTIAMGIFVMCAVNGIFGPVKNPSQSPIWVGMLAGLVFVAGGVLVFVQAFTEGTEPPLWARIVLLAGLLTITGGLASIALWVSLGQGPREFQVSGSFGSGHSSGIIGRVVFGIGGLAVGAMFIAFLVSAVKQLLGRNDA
jgi:hypothetical protein